MNMINTILRHPRRTAIVLSFLSFCLYASSTPIFNVGYGDSDEFLTAGKTWGIAHPPGFPLYTTMLHTAMSLQIPGTSETQRAHLVSGICAAATLYFMALLTFQLTKPRKQKYSNAYGRLAAIVATVVSGATATSFWTYSQIAEKYLLTAFFISLIIYVGYNILHVESKKLPIKSILLFMMFYGLALSHSQTLLFLSPYILYVLYRTKLYASPKQLSLAIITGITSFIVPFVILIVQNDTHPLVSWPLEPGIQGLVTFITKNDFRGEVFGASAEKAAYFPKSITLRQIIDGSLHYVVAVGSSFSWWIVIPLLITLTHLWKRNKQLLLEISLPLLSLGFVQASFLNWPTDLQNQSQVIRLYTVSLITVLPLIIVGMHELFVRMFEIAKILNVKTTVANIFVFCVASIPFFLACIYYNDISLKKFTLTSTLYKHILDSVTDNSIVTCYSERSCAALIYEQVVNSKRPDVQIVTMSGYPSQLRQNGVELQHFLYDKNPWKMYDVVTWNVGKKPVYAVDFSSQYYTLFGVSQGYMFYIPMGYYGQLARQMPSTIPSYDSSITQSVLKSSINSNDYMQRLLIQSLEQNHFTNGSVLLAMGSRDAARIEVSHAVNLSYLLTADDKKQALGTRGRIENGITNPHFTLESSTVPVSDLLKKIPTLYQQKKESQVLKLALGAITIDPSHIEARLELANVYVKLGNLPMALTEYQNVLILDPKNSVAIDQLNKITR